MAYRLSNKQLEAIMRNSLLQRQLRTTGRQVASRAQSITRSDGGTAEISLVTGIRPRGRAYTNVQSSSADEEYGTSTRKRRRALGRAARER